MVKHLMFIIQFSSIIFLPQNLLPSCIHTQNTKRHFLLKIPCSCAKNVGFFALSYKSEKFCPE